MANRIVIALEECSSNNPENISAEAQLKAVEKTAVSIVDFIEEGHEIVIVHGNGPQVGQIVSAYEKGRDVPNMPFPNVEL